MEKPGLSDHEILMELRDDVKLILAWVPTVVTWGKLGGALAVLATITVGAVKLFM